MSLFIKATLSTLLRRGPSCSLASSERCLALTKTTFVPLESENLAPDKQRMVQTEEQFNVESRLILNPFEEVNEANKTYLEQLRPPPKRSFNLAAYVNISKTLQELLKLGVSLYDIENFNNAAAALLLKLDFQKDCAPYVKFLVDVGVKKKNLGRFITEFPMIFKEHLDDLQVRINYLESKGFTDEMIAKMLNRSAMPLSMPTKTFDYKLGSLQIEFNLPAPILRNMVIMHPQIVCLPVGQYKLVRFTLDKEFGFTTSEIHKILEVQPKVLDIPRPDLFERLDRIHNIIGLTHKTISEFPKLITGPQMDIERRFNYLKVLKRNQFNPTKPLYVPPPALYNTSDEEFCTKYAKTSVDDYELFLRSS